jgi:hypothetical protein
VRGLESLFEATTAARLVRSALVFIPLDMSGVGSMTVACSIRSGAMRLVGAAQDLSAASPRRQSLEGGLGLREPETHLHLGKERNGGSEVLGTVGTTEQAG